MTSSTQLWDTNGADTDTFVIPTYNLLHTSVQLQEAPSKFLPGSALAMSGIFAVIYVSSGLRLKSARYTSPRKQERIIIIRKREE